MKYIVIVALAVAGISTIAPMAFADGASSTQRHRSSPILDDLNAAQQESAQQAGDWNGNGEVNGPDFNAGKPFEINDRIGGQVNGGEAGSGRS